MSELNQENFKYIASVRFQNTRKPYTFGTNDETLEYGDFVVVETARGKELGEMISSLRDASSFNGQTALKPIERKATYEDKVMHEENKELAKDALKKCAECIQNLNLDMNLISCEYTLDRSKVIFVYVSENRVDFRELLKDLTQVFKCRIELRQIGPRDKAKMVGGLGACGLETCCSRFLDNFDVVSINMAKNQLLALNIPKLSGQCGKLMCCLKYEDELYKELRQGLPKMNAQMEYEGKVYRLTSMNVITGQCKLENKENAVFLSIEEMMAKATVKKPVPQQPKKDKESKNQDKKPKIQEKEEQPTDVIREVKPIQEEVKEVSITIQDSKEEAPARKEHRGHKGKQNDKSSSGQNEMKQKKERREHRERTDVTKEKIENKANKEHREARTFKPKNEEGNPGANQEEKKVNHYHPRRRHRNNREGGKSSSNKENA